LSGAVDIDTGVFSPKLSIQTSTRVFSPRLLAKCEFRKQRADIRVFIPKLSVQITENTSTRVFSPRLLVFLLRVKEVG
jgi:hypothetical protein